MLQVRVGLALSVLQVPFRHFVSFLLALLQLLLQFISIQPIVNVLLGVLLQVGELLLVDGGYFGLFLLLLDFHELLFRVLPLREKDVFDPGVNARLANNLIGHVVREYLVVVQKGLVLLLLVLLEHFLLDVLLFKPLV